MKATLNGRLPDFQSPYITYLWPGLPQTAVTTPGLRPSGHGLAGRTSTASSRPR